MVNAIKTMKTLKYGGVPTQEAAVVIRLDKQDHLAYVNSTWPEWSRKLERQHGTPKRYSERNGVVESAFWTLPLASISIRSSRKAGKQSRKAPQNARKSPGNDITAHSQEKKVKRRTLCLSVRDRRL